MYLEYFLNSLNLNGIANPYNQKKPECGTFQVFGYGNTVRKRAEKICFFGINKGRFSFGVCITFNLNHGISQ
jgi:hypothetical protein